jgi:hypothetical protein
MSNKISATNLGPIGEAAFVLDAPGVTRLVAPNGSGKSILLEAVQAAAKGEGKLPLRDRARKGKVEAFGATITIGGTCRHTGSFEVTNLEGRFDLAALVDPRLKSPTAADKARIKALVALTGVEANPNLFREHESFEDFDDIIESDSLETDDLVEMAAKVKRLYDDEALKAERRAEREFGKVSALIPSSDIDLTEEDDQQVLQEAYNEARDRIVRLQQQKSQSAITQEHYRKAEEMLEAFSNNELQKERADLTEFLVTSETKIDEANEEIEHLLGKVEALRQMVKDTKDRKVLSEDRIKTIDSQLQLVEEAKAVVADTKVLACPTDEDIEEAQQQLAECSAAIERGVKVRAAKESAAEAKKHRELAREYQDRAGSYRDAAKATDEVLSASIKCPQLRVESDGKAARLVADHPIRGESVPYHDLSDGERWTIAIDIGADQVGEGGLLVISQVGWEGIDGANRKAIHEHAVARNVYILTAEASEDPEAGREIQPTRMDGTVIPHDASVSETPKRRRRVKKTEEPDEDDTSTPMF